MINFKDEFPGLFAPPALACWSSVPEGWVTVVREALIELDRLRILDYPKLRVDQVKEKFGGLRIYTNTTSDEISAIVRKAEASVGCQVCGAPARVVNRGGYASRVCEAHK